MLPNFLIIGAQKAGTTSLWRYLRAHPDVFMSEVKELRFFGAPHPDRTLDWYQRQFEGAEDSIAVGEASPEYTSHPIRTGAPARIAALLPDVQMIYLVRDPIERMRSHYEHMVTHGRERRSLEVALFTEQRYIAYSRYAMQLDRYLDHFRRDQVLVLTSESLHYDRRTAMASVYDFLGVGWHWDGSLDREYHRSQDRGGAGDVLTRALRTAGLRRVARRRAGKGDLRRRVEVPSGVRRQLESLLRDDVARLRSFLPEAFDGWGIA